jgi:hypothetical protein
MQVRMREILNFPITRHEAAGVTYFETGSGIHPPRAVFHQASAPQ